MSFGEQWRVSISWCSGWGAAALPKRDLRLVFQESLFQPSCPGVQVMVLAALAVPERAAIVLVDLRKLVLLLLRL